MVQIDLHYWVAWKTFLLEKKKKTSLDWIGLKQRVWLGDNWQ